RTPTLGPSPQGGGRRKSRWFPSPLRGGVRGGGSGAGEMLGNCCPDPIEIFHLVVGKTQDCVACGAQELVAHLVITPGAVAAMGIAVQLDDQFGPMGGEIGKIGTDGRLAAEMLLGEGLPQQGP